MVKKAPFRYVLILSYEYTISVKGSLRALDFLMQPDSGRGIDKQQTHSRMLRSAWMEGRGRGVPCPSGCVRDRQIRS